MGGEFKTDFGTERIGLAIAAGGFGFDDAGRAELQGAERHVDGVTGHVAKSAGAEIHPTAPVERMINILLEGPRLRGADPEVPIHPFRNGVRAVRPRATLRPDGPVRPNMDFLRATNQAGL